MNKRHLLGFWLLGFSVYLFFTIDLWPDRLVIILSTFGLSLDPSAAVTITQVWNFLLVAGALLAFFGFSGSEERTFYHEELVETIKRLEQAESSGGFPNDESGLRVRRPELRVFLLILSGSPSRSIRPMIGL